MIVNENQDPEVARLVAEATAGLRKTLGELLDDVHKAYRRYIGFASQAQSVALTLWTAHSHAIEAADCTPYIRVYSAEKESGKTRTEEVAFHLVGSGVRASSVSASALFRMIDAHHPTLLVDEVDAIFAPKSEQEDLRSILNAGYERGNPVYRSVAVGKQWDATAYDAFCPKMLAGIENGRLPDTLVSRSIPVALQRKRKGDPSVAKFRKRKDPPRLHALREGLAAWATDDVARELADAYPEPAPGLTDRQDDIWEPLIAIADMAGGDWPSRARAAAAELHAGDPENESYGVLLLGDIRDVVRDDEPISTFELATRLVKEGDRGPWADWWGKFVESDSPASRKSVGHQIGRKLKPYGIKATQVWADGENVRGFPAGAFADAFDRYLPSPQPENARTLDRRSDPLSGPGVQDTDTPSDQASSVLAFQGTENGQSGSLVVEVDPQPDLERRVLVGADLVRIVRDTLAAHMGAGSPGTAAAFELAAIGIEPPYGRAVWTGALIERLLREEGR